METLHTIQFGTDGWRGKLDSELHTGSVERVAQAFSIYILQNSNNLLPSVAVSYDGRRNSRYFASLFAHVLSGNGIAVFLSDRITPTPVLSYYVQYHQLSAGVMITASHNPPAYNGVKFKNFQGAPFATEETKTVEQLIDKHTVKKSEDVITLTDMMHDYLAHVESLIDFTAIKQSGIFPCIDSMGGAGQQIITEILGRHGIKSKSIFHIADENFSGRKAEPIAANLNALRQELQNSPSFSVGLATDGDADRLGILTENGDWFSAHETILALADYYTKVRGITGDIIKSSSVTAKLEMLGSENRKVHNVQVGFKYISEKMIETNAAFGAEESGGFGFKEHLPERDGIFSGLLFLELLAKSGFKNVSSLKSAMVNTYGTIHYDRIDHDYLPNDRMEILPNLLTKQINNICDFPVESTEQFLSSRGIVNGIKFYLHNYRWLLLRCSETEPMFRIYAEANSDAEVKELLQKGLHYINQKEK